MHALRHGLLVTGRRTGAWRLPAAWHGSRRLTVLAYHRIARTTDPGFTGYAGNASADPDEFSEQIGWVKEHYNPVTLGEVADAVAGGSLPPRPLLVTFDDGYRDNLTTALPVLKRHGVPATVFLATDHIGTDRPFWWDRAAWCLSVAPAQQVRLPLTGLVNLTGDRTRLIRSWVQQAKHVPDDEMRTAVESLPVLLGVVERPAEFGRAILGWDDVATMAADGVEFGAHTCSHPILTRMPPPLAAAEVAGSVRRVAEAIGRTPIGFAYPNGHRGDLDDVIEAAVAAAGIRLAFTLAPGPARWSAVVRRPLRIRRVYVHHGDGLDRFVAKVAGVPRFIRGMG